MPRIIAFDYGRKRIGLAVTDPLQIIATGLRTLHPKDIINYLKKYLETEQVEMFLVGEPKQLNGMPSECAGEINGFIKTLRKHFPTISVKTMDERFTSKMASATIAKSGLKKTARQDKTLVDTISAIIILQSYLDQEQWRINS